MNRPVLAVLGAALLLVLVFFGVGASLADRWRVETVRTLPVAPARVQATLTDLATWQKWSSVDAVLGPSTERTVEGATGTVGSVLRWRGSEGEATLTLTEVAPGRVRYDFAVTGHGVLGGGGFDLVAEGEGTRVTWHDQGRLSSVISRWVGWFGAVQDSVKKQQEASLARLDTHLQAPK